jgi:hypothetical protein
MAKKIIAPTYDTKDLANLLDSLEGPADSDTSIDTPKEVEAAQEPVQEPTQNATDIDSLAAELGIDLSGVELTPPAPSAPVKEKKPRVKKETKPKVEKAPKPPKEEKPSGSKKRGKKPSEQNEETSDLHGDAKKSEEPKQKLERVQIKMDAPIPVVQFRDLTIGYYGNILEPLPEPDKHGYTWKEVPKQKFHPAAQEANRSKGRMVLVINAEAKRYLVAIEEGESLEGIIEVTNKGRGSLRCRQLAQALGVAFTEKADELPVDPMKYAELMEKTPKPRLNLGA